MCSLSHNHIETLENTTNDENQIEETTIGFSVVIVVDAQMSAAMDEWFSCLQKMMKINSRKFCSCSHHRACLMRCHVPLPYTRQFFLLRWCLPSHLYNHFVHLQPILLLTPEFMYCHLILVSHHHFCRQICMSCHLLIQVIISMLRILKITQHLRLSHSNHNLQASSRISQ